MLVEDRTQHVSQQNGFGQPAMASLALDWRRGVVALGNEREHLVVEVGHQPEHEARFSLVGIVVFVELDPFERDAVSANVAVLTSHAQRERKVTHDPKETIARDVGRKDPQILELVWNLRRDRCAGHRQQHGRADGCAHDEPARADLVCCQR